MAKRVTASDVAAEAGVSRAAVSRSFTEGAPVSPQVRARVLAAAARVGYKPNAIARMLNQQRSDIVGIVMGGFENPFYPNVLARLTNRLQEENLRALVFTIGPSQTVDDLIPMVMQYQVTAIVIASATLSSNMAQRCVESGTPVILLNRTVAGRLTNSVSCDNYAGGRLAAEVLLDAGCRKLAFISGDPDTSTNRERRDGFRARLASAGLELVGEDGGAFAYRLGYEAAVRLLSAETAPDAIFCANDILALGAIDGARLECGLAVGSGVSILGFDDIPNAAWPSYDLTTIRQPVEEMVEETIKLCLRSQSDTASEPVEIRIPVALVRRGSVRMIAPPHRIKSDRPQLLASNQQAP